MTKKQAQLELEQAAKEKAQELYMDFYDSLWYLDSEDREDNSEKAAIITCDWLIKEQEMWQNGQTNPVKFWQKVKKELWER